MAYIKSIKSNITQYKGNKPNFMFRTDYYFDVYYNINVCGVHINFTDHVNIGISWGSLQSAWGSLPKTLTLLVCLSSLVIVKLSYLQSFIFRLHFCQVIHFWPFQKLFNECWFLKTFSCFDGTITLPEVIWYAAAFISGKYVQANKKRRKSNYNYYSSSLIFLGNINL